MVRGSAGATARYRLLTLLLLLAAPVAQSSAQHPNILANPGFESGTTGWRFFTNGTGSFVSVTPGFTGLRAGEVTIATTGSNMQLYQSSLTLEPGTRYTFSFAAYSSRGRDVSVSLLKQVSPFTGYGLSNRVFNLTTGWQVFTIEFETTGFDSIVHDARLRFWFVNYAADGEVYYLDDVELRKTVVLPSAPAISRQPVSRTVVVNDTAVFSISASGTPPLTYRWQRDGTDIDGALSPWYTTPPALPSDSGAGFRCIVGNALGSDTSLTAMLNVSPPLAIRFWYGRQQTFGTPGDPVPAVNVLGNVFAARGLASLTYTLNGGAPLPLSRGPDTQRLQERGDFNIDIPCSALSDGANRIIVEARDSTAAAAIDTVILTYGGGNVWPLPYTIDWRTAGMPQRAAQVLDGIWTVDTTAGTLRTIQPGYDRLVAIGARTWTDYDVIAPVTIHGIDSAGFAPPSSGPGIGFLLRWPGHSDLPPAVAGRQPKTGYLPLGAIAWYRYRSDGERMMLIGNNLQTLAQETGARRLIPGTRYVFRARVETVDGLGPRYSLRVWQDGTPEPSGWDLTGQEELSDPQEGCLLLLAHHVDASFGNVTVIPAGTPAYALAMQTEGSGEIVRDPDLPLYPPGQTVTLTALPAPGWRFDSWSGDLTGSSNPAAIAMNGNRSVTAAFTRLPARPAIVADEFSAPALDTLIWTFVNPLSDATLTQTGGRVSITIPAGPAHDVREDGNKAPRIMQQAADTSFEMEARYSSVMTAGTQVQGILVEQDTANFIRFDFIGDGKSTRVFAASFTAGQATVRIDTLIAGVAPPFLGIRREGSLWTQRCSPDGKAWTTTGSFLHPMAVTRVGPFFGTSGDPAPAFTGLIDYFRTPVSAVNPILPLDRLAENPGPLPSAYALEQNYPNPFNAETEIIYSVPPPRQTAPGPGQGAETGAWVTLSVYDILGREIVRLVDGAVQPGTHRVRLQGRGLPSGVFFYRMQGSRESESSFTISRAMVLLR